MEGMEAARESELCSVGLLTFFFFALFLVGSGREAGKEGIVREEVGGDAVEGRGLGEGVTSVSLGLGEG